MDFTFASSSILPHTIFEYSASCLSLAIAFMITKIEIAIIKNRNFTDTIKENKVMLKDMLVIFIMIIVFLLWQHLSKRILLTRLLILFMDYKKMSCLSTLLILFLKNGVLAEIIEFQFLFNYYINFSLQSIKSNKKRNNSASQKLNECTADKNKRVIEIN